MSAHSKIYLIPSPLAYPLVHPEISVYYLSALKQCNILCVENLKTARKFLKYLDKHININNFYWLEIHKNTADYIPEINTFLKEGKNIGIISDAGCPGIADPGQIIVRKGHTFGAKIIPLIGGSSILLALMASGMNGQNFTFLGYLPIEQEKRIQSIKYIETTSRQTGQTQIFIETPYRNQVLFQTLLSQCGDNTSLCLATNLTGTLENIHTKSVKEWKKIPHTCPKLPTVFLLNASV